MPAYAEMEFFHGEGLAAFNIRWFEDPEYPKSISTYVVNPHTGDKKSLVRDGVPAIEGPYEQLYAPYLESLAGADGTR